MGRRVSGKVNRENQAMNYIQRVKHENETLRQALVAWERGLTDIRAYLESPKFWTDTTVQVADVHVRLTEARCRVTDVLVNAGLEVEGVY